jgi:acyl-coenzyme A thioesterase PaaI-like protein
MWLSGELRASLDHAHSQRRKAKSMSSIADAGFGRERSILRARRVGNAVWVLVGYGERLHLPNHPQSHPPRPSPTQILSPTSSPRMNKLFALLITPAWRSFDAVLNLILVILSFAIALPFATFQLLTKGSKSFAKTTQKFEFFNALPLGRYAFSAIVGLMAPYSASVNPFVLTLTDNQCSIEIVERPWLHNPFSSIHAIALANAGELCSGLLVTSSLQSAPKGSRGIVTELSTTYAKKARGRIVASSNFEIKQGKEGTDYEEVVETRLTDSKGETCAAVRAVWKIQIGGGKDKKKTK